MRQPWTDEDQEIAEALRATGWTYRAIGQRLGRSHTAIMRHLSPEARARERERSARYPEKNSEKVARWKRKNRKQVQEYTQHYVALKRASQRVSFAVLTPEQKEARFSLFGNRCAYCGSSEGLTVDHVLPFSRGGRDEASNVVPACRSCNASKRASLVQAWYQQQAFFNEKQWQKIQHHCPSATEARPTLWA